MKQVLKKSLLAGTAFSLWLQFTSPLPAHAQGKEVNTVVSSEMATIDPAKASDAPSGNIIHNRLWRFDPWIARLRSHAQLNLGKSAKMARPIPSNYVQTLNGLTATLLLQVTLSMPETSHQSWNKDYAGLIFSSLKGHKPTTKAKGAQTKLAVCGWRHYLEAKLVNPTAYFLSLTSFLCICTC